MGLSALLIFANCSKDVKLGEDPYAGGKESLGIAFYKDYAEPEIAEPGSEVMFHVKGLKKHEGKFQFFINDNLVDIKNVADSSITIVLPENISSGGAMIKMDNQFFNGPIIYIDGNVSVDKNFDIVNGFNSTVRDIMPYGGGNVVVGAFTDFEKEASASVFRNGLHYINSLGKSDNAVNFQRGTGSSGFVNKVLQQGNKFFAGGSFSNFNRRHVENVVRLNVNGSLDSVVVEVLNPTPDKPENGLDTVAAFNGGTLGGIGGGTFQAGTIIDLFPVADNKLIAIGGFYFHQKIDYRYSSRESRRTVITPVRNVLRFKQDGSLDSTFMMNNAGANGPVTGGAILPNDKLLVVGAFKSFNGKTVNNIVCLNAKGEVDPSFASGTGADDGITSVHYNASLKKIVLTGRFKSFNGVKANGVVILDEAGKVDTQFKLGDIEDGAVFFGHLLNNGKVLISGTMKKYDGVQRSSVLILNPDGKADQKYNNIGVFAGMVNKVVETTSSLGRPALLLGGTILRVEDQNVGNIVKLEIKD